MVAIIRHSLSSLYYILRAAAPRVSLPASSSSSAGSLCPRGHQDSSGHAEPVTGLEQRV